MVEEIKSLGEFEIQKAEKDGTTHDAKITKLEKGKIKDFVRGDISAWKNPDGVAVNVHVKSETGKTIEKMIALPEDGSKVNEKSTLGKFIKQYKSSPSVGLAVKTVIQDGFENLLILR